MRTDARPLFAARFVVSACVILANVVGCMEGESEESAEDEEVLVEDGEDVSPEGIVYTLPRAPHEPVLCPSGWEYYESETAGISRTDGITGDCHQKCRPGFMVWDQWTCVSCKKPTLYGFTPICADPDGTLQTTYHRGAAIPPICASDEVLTTVWSIYAPPQTLCHKR